MDGQDQDQTDRSANPSGTLKPTSNKAYEPDERDGSNNAGGVLNSPGLVTVARSDAASGTSLERRTETNTGEILGARSGGGNNEGASVLSSDADQLRPLPVGPQSAETRSRRSSSSSRKKDGKLAPNPEDPFEKGEEVKGDFEKNLPPSPPRSVSEKMRQEKEGREFDQQRGSGPPFPHHTRSLRFQQSPPLSFQAPEGEGSRVSSHALLGGFATEPGGYLESEYANEARSTARPPFRTTGSSANGTRDNPMENVHRRGMSGTGGGEGQLSRAPSGTGNGNESYSRPFSIRGDKRDAEKSRSGLEWIVPAVEGEKFTHEATAGQRLQPTLITARRERDKCSARARWTGMVLNIAIALQLLLGALTTGIAAALSGRKISIAISILGGATTLVASYIAKSRGSGEPELSITRKKDLDQFIRECETFQMDHGHNLGSVKDFELNDFREKYEELLGNGSGERKLNKPI